MSFHRAVGWYYFLMNRLNSVLCVEEGDHWNVMWSYNGDGTTDKTGRAENEVATQCR